MRLLPWLRFRPLFPVELAFLDRYFGTALDARPIRLTVSFGRRSYAPLGARIGLARGHFEGEDPTRPVALGRARSASVFAHEALHVWQRQRGVFVTLHGARLQVPYTLFGRNPYRYDSCDAPDALFARFCAANIEQQGQMVQDYVLSAERGECTARFAGIAAHIRGG